MLPFGCPRSPVFEACASAYGLVHLRHRHGPPLAQMLQDARERLIARAGGSPKDDLAGWLHRECHPVALTQLQALAYLTRERYLAFGCQRTARHALHYSTLQQNVRSPPWARILLHDGVCTMNLMWAREGEVLP